MKKILVLLISFLLFINGYKALKLDINSKYAIVYNLTEDRIMYEKNAYDEIKVASLTKIMTAIIVIENNKDLEKEVTIIDDDLRDMYEYTTTGFQKDDKVTIRDLLYGILLKSGSDAVNAAVRVTTKTEDEFIRLMNQKVKELNLTHTYFSNPIGKDEDNYSSVSDISKIMEYCLKNETFREIISEESYYVDNLDLTINGPLYNSVSKYDIDTSFVTGAKTGYTTESKHSMVSFSEKDDLNYIVVTSYAENYKNLLNDTNILYNYMFNNYGYKDYSVNFNLDIENGKEKNYNVNLDTKLYLENNYDKDLITYKYKGKNKINFLVNKGDKLGTVQIFYDKRLIKTVNVRLNKNLKYKPKAYIKLSSFVIVIIIIFVFIIFKSKIKIKKKTVIKHKNNKIKPQIKPKVEKFIIEENSLSKKLKILKNTIDVNIFFDTLKSVSYTKQDKEKFEHDFIDRCFQSINFENLEELQDLYTKLKLYKNEMNNTTIKYYNKLFKYCIEEYIDKK